MSDENSSVTLTVGQCRVLAQSLIIMGTLFEKLGKAKAAAEPADDAPADDATPKRKAGRPPKTDKPADETPAEDDKTITEDHPKRAELRKIATQYAEKTSREDAQKCMKLFGESSKVVPDDDLAGAITYFKNALAKLGKPAKSETEDI
jgi:hypothetical protein